MNMQSYRYPRTNLFIIAISSALLCQPLVGQEAKSADPRSREMNGIPPRTAATEYQAQTKAGAITIAADFDGHSVPTPESVFSTEDFIMCEVAFYCASTVVRSWYPLSEISSSSNL